MILGDTCTRACGFCAINSGRPEAIDPLEPVRLAQAVETLGLDYAVITSVNRDDVPDGGAGIFAACIRAVRHRAPSCDVEVLIPDFEGNWDALGNRAGSATGGAQPQHGVGTAAVPARTTEGRLPAHAGAVPRIEASGAGRSR